MAHFHAVLDYPDEDIDPFTLTKLEDDLSARAGLSMTCWPPTSGDAGSIKASAASW